MRKHFSFPLLAFLEFGGPFRAGFFIRGDSVQSRFIFVVVAGDGWA